MTYYTVKTELKTPWIGKPYIEYQLVKHWVDFEMYWPSNWGEDRNHQKVIFKSKEQDIVSKFMEKLNMSNLQVNP